MRRLFILLFTASLLIGGCSSSSDDSGDSAGSGDTGSQPAQESDSPTTDEDLGTCEVTVTGDTDLTMDEPAGPVPASSDYWLSEDDMRTDTLDLVEDLDERLANGQQVVVLLQVSCGDPVLGESVLLNSTDATTRTDLPFSPGSYPLLPSLASPEPGIAAGLTTRDDFNWQTLDGTVEITAWDDSHVAGSFQFDVEQAAGFVEDGVEPLTASVAGTFDLPCQLGENCKS